MSALDDIIGVGTLPTGAMPNRTGALVERDERRVGSLDEWTSHSRDNYHGRDTEAGV